MEDNTLYVVILLMAGFVMGYICFGLGANNRPRRYGYGRNPFRRFCGECGQEQLQVNRIGYDQNESWWEPNGEIRDRGCDCHKDCQAHY